MIIQRSPMPQFQRVTGNPVSDLFIIEIHAVDSLHVAVDADAGYGEEGIFPEEIRCLIAADRHDQRIVSGMGQLMKKGIRICFLPEIEEIHMSALFIQDPIHSGCDLRGAVVNVVRIGFLQFRDHGDADSFQAFRTTRKGDHLHPLPGDALQNAFGTKSVQRRPDHAQRNRILFAQRLHAGNRHSGIRPLPVQFRNKTIPAEGLKPNHFQRIQTPFSRFFPCFLKFGHDRNLSEII